MFSENSRKKYDKKYSKINKKTQKKTTEKILSIIVENPSVSIKEIAVIIGNITPDGVHYHVNKLKKVGVLERVVADKGGYWKVYSPQDYQKNID